MCTRVPDAGSLDIGIANMGFKPAVFGPGAAIVVGVSRPGAR
jgi:hypothetical protein